MTLCDICRAIPWDALPEIPPNVVNTFTNWYSHIQMFRDWPWEYKGRLFYSSLEALQSSATESSCDLCSIILSQVLKCEEELKTIVGQNYMGSLSSGFWLVRSPSKGNGVWVMTFRNGMKGFAMLVAAIGLCAREGDALEKVIRGRPVEPQRGSATAISRVRNWLNECDKHPHWSLTGSFLPSRVIDVGDNISSSYVKLCDARNHEPARYLALSYCWGNTPQLKTTKATLEDRKRCIMVSCLPQTHRDAVQLTRELGVRYLWIDSICIIQDDTEDWERESASMVSIYANSYLTIAASNGSDSHQGIFTEILPRRYVPIDLKLGDYHGQALAFSCPVQEEASCIEQYRTGMHDATRIHYITLPKEPLSGRGWTLQERVLSHRTLVYSHYQTFFECREGYQGEDGLFLKTHFETIYEKSDKRNTSSKEETLQAWYRLLKLYGERTLSRPSDKLPAISGLAAIFATRLDDQYMAGLWRSDIIRGLCWSWYSYCRRQREYRAPSWSWASVDTLMGGDIDFTFHELATILEVDITPKGANPYGEVLEGKIGISAPLKRLYPPEKGRRLTIHDLGNPLRLKFHPDDFQDSAVCGHFDFYASTEGDPQVAATFLREIEESELYALILLERTDSSGLGWPVRGLIVAKMKEREEYQRFGHVMVKRSVFTHAMEGDDRVATITII